MSSLRLRGATHFRQRIICSTLTGRVIRIDDIRVDSENPGLRDYEGNFLRLIEKITNGCKIEINETGTALRYHPGFVMGGKIQHDCGSSRAIGWFLEAIIPLCIFAKAPVTLLLRGITNDDVDISVDLLRTVILPTLKHFGVEEGLELKVKKRGAPPDGGGELVFKCPVLRELRPINMTDAGLIRRVRGVAYCTRVSPQTGNRMIDTARGVLNSFLPDVYIYSDHYGGPTGGNSPGYAVQLTAESTTGCLIGAEAAATPGGQPTTPEELGSSASTLLLEQLSSGGGCADAAAVPLMLLLMLLTPEDVSRLRVGKLTPYSIQYLRHLHEFFGVKFKIRADEETKTVLLSCLGTGYRNLSKKVT